MKNPNIRQLIIVDPSYSESKQGHYCSYDHGIAVEARKNHKVKLLGAMSAELTIDSNSSVDESLLVPTFTLDIWGKSNLDFKDYGLRSKLSKETLLADFEKSMSKLSFHVPTVFFFPNFTEPQLGIVSRLNEGFYQFETIIVLRYQIEITPIQELATLRQSYIENSNFLTILTDSSELSSQLNNISEGIIKSVLPVPHGMLYLREKNLGRKGKTRFIHLGNPRIEKGFQEITKAILDDSKKSDCEFIIQVSNPEKTLDSVIADFTRLKTSNVSVITEVLSNEDYSKLLSSSNFTLAPYQPSIYAHRTSSVVSESQAVAVPVIATAGTVGGDLVRASGAGIVVSELTTKKISEAILDASQRVPELTLRAEMQRSAVFYSGTFEQLWQAIITNSNILRRKKAVIFYPWSFQDVRYSGAGNRLLSTIRNLHDLGVEVTVFNGLGVRRRRYLDVDFIPLELIFEMQRDSNLALHKSNIELEANLELQRNLKYADFVVFEGTHLVNCMEKALIEHSIHDVFVISHDVIKPISDQNSEELLDLQIHAMTNYRAYSLSKDEIEIWQKIGLEVSFTKPTDFDDLSGTSEIFNSLAEQLIEHVVTKEDKVLLFVGGSYWPNVEAANFAKEFIKLLREEYPDFKLVIVGSVCEIANSESWVTVGKVSRNVLEAFYQRASVVFIPMFHGTGVSIKTIEALKRNKPIFTTEIGVRGLNLLEKSSCYISKVAESDVRGMVIDFSKAYFEGYIPEIRFIQDEPDVFVDTVGKLFSNPHKIIPSKLSAVQDLSNMEITQASTAEILSNVQGDEFELHIRYLLAFYTFKRGVLTKSTLLDILSNGVFSNFGGNITEELVEKDTKRLILSSLHFKILNDSQCYIDDEDLELWYNFTREFTQQNLYDGAEPQRRIFTLYTVALRIQKYWIIRKLLSSRLFLNSKIMRTYRIWKHRPLKTLKKSW